MGRNQGGVSTLLQHATYRMMMARLRLEVGLYAARLLITPL